MLFRLISPAEFDAAMDRIGASDRLRDGLAVDGDVTLEDVVAALRATPAGTGDAGFERTLRLIVDARRAPVLLCRRLLWVDCSAGLLVGVAGVALAGPLSRLYALPRELLLGMAMANLAYGTFSYSLARRAQRPPALLGLLVVANGTWAGLCWLAAVLLAERASAFGVAHLVAEGVFVGGLAALEWRHRECLRSAT